MKTWAFVAAIGTVTALLLPATPSLGAGGSTEIISLNDSEELGNQSSGDSSVSKGGRYVAFQSNASNLVPNDNNMINDVFVRVRSTGTTERVSVSSYGEQANGISFGTAISEDGRYVAFTSHASNLVPKDTNGTSDAFVHDRLTGETELITVSLKGESGNGATFFGLDMSADGRFVAFTSNAGDLTDDPDTLHSEVYVRDRVLGTTERITLSPNGSISNRRSESEPSISADGRFVAFASSASNLAPRDDNRAGDVFVRDRDSDTTVLVSRGKDGYSGLGASRLPDISDDGRHVVFASVAGNLVESDTNEAEDVFIHNLVGGAMRRISLMPDGSEADPEIATQVKSSISAHGRYVAFNYMSPLVEGLTGEQSRAYLWDRATRELELVSVNNQGEPATPDVGLDDVSPHGKYVAFFANAGNLTPSPTDPPQAYLRVRSS